MFVSVQLSVVEFFLNKAERSAGWTFAQERSKNDLPQFVVDQKQDEERPRCKPPRPPVHSSQLYDEAIKISRNVVEYTGINYLKT